MTLFNKKYYEYVHAGKMSLSYEKGKHILCQIVASYDEDEIKDSFKKFINNLLDTNLTV